MEWQVDNETFTEGACVRPPTDGYCETWFPFLSSLLSSRRPVVERE